MADRKDVAIPPTDLTPEQIAAALLRPPKPQNAKPKGERLPS